MIGDLNMAEVPLGIYDSFSEKGLFWLANCREDKIPGTLSYDPQDGAVIELLGIFGDVREAMKRMLGGEQSDRNIVIHGITMKGKPISLLGAHRTRQQLHMPGIAHENWTSNLMVIGAYITNANEEAIFRKSYFRFEGIEAWLEHRPFTDNFDHETKSLSVLAEKPREVAFASHSDFEVSSVGSLYSNNKPVTRFTIDVISQMAITPHEPQSLTWHLDRALRLQELASLCTGRYLPLISFELRGPDIQMDPGGTLPTEVYFYARMVHGGGNDEAPHSIPMLSGPELVRFNPKAVQLWFNQFETFSPALNLFFTVTGQKHMFANIRLLLAIQALEVFHRRTTGDAVMASDKFDDFAKAMVAAIPPETERRMRDKLIGLYKFANEPSLNQRLRSIVATLTEAFGDIPGGFGDRFIRELVDTRNYYTHFSAELSDRALDGKGMYWAGRRVTLLLSLLFLLRLGISADEIKPLLNRHREFTQLWANAGPPT